MSNTDIPISQVVNVSIVTTPTAPSRAGFGTMLICTQEVSANLPISTGIKYYTSSTEVAADFPAVSGVDSEAYKAANTYFAQSPKPLKIAIATRYLTAQKSSMLGGGDEATVAQFQAVTAGSVVFSISTAGVPATKVLTALNFSTDTTPALIATRIQTALLAGATGAFVGCTFTHNGTQFVFTSGTTGSTVSVDYCVDHTSGTNIASMLKMKQGEVAGKSAGLDAETSVSAFLNRINALDSGWYAFAFTKETRDSYKADAVNKDVVVAASWCQDKIKQFFTVTNTDTTRLSTFDSLQPTADTASHLKSLGLSRTFCIYSSKPSEYPEVSAFARAATTDFSFTNSTITLKFKQLPLCSAEILTSSQLANLTSKGCNVYGTVGGVDMLMDAMMTPGQGTYQDTIHGIDWLQNAIETNVFGYLYTRTTKVPYTDEGVQMIVQQIEKALDQAVNNGLVAPGYDLDGVYYKRGYNVTAGAIKDVDMATRQKRIAPPISFVCVGAGAIHNVVIKGLFNA